MTPTPDQWRDAMKAAESGRPRILVNMWKDHGLPIELHFAVCDLLMRLQGKEPSTRDKQLAKAVLDHWKQTPRIGEREAFESVRKNPTYAIDDDSTLANAINGTRDGIKRAFEEMTGAPWKSPREWRASV